jgi:flavodoxin
MINPLLRASRRAHPECKKPKMKFIILLRVAAFIAVFFSVTCVFGQPLKDGNILVVYLSRTNNTKAVAEIIHHHMGGKLVALELEQPYPDDYKATVDQVARENEIGFLPKLKTKIDSIARYDIIFVGFPTWGMQLPPPIKSFLKEYNLSGKIVVPFNTNAGYGIGTSF